MKRVPFRFPQHITFFLAAYTLGMVFFLIFRTVLLSTNISQASALPEHQIVSLIFQAMIMGLRFDTVVSGYILALPLILLIIQSFLSFESRIALILRVAAFWLAGILYTVAFMICSADIPFFNYYFSRLTTAVLNWADERSFMVGMIFKEKSYLLYVVICIILSSVFWRAYYLLFKGLLKSESKRPTITLNIVGSLLLILATFVGIRGRLETKSPIRAGTAAFSEFAFPNQLGLNPVFTFLRSYLDDLEGKTTRLQLINEAEAIRNVQAYFQTSEGIERVIAGRKKPDSLNVVVVIMESMSAHKMHRYGNSLIVTPFLDSLASISYCFDNFYSAGIHTYNGVYSTLYSFPSLMKQHPMKMTTVPSMTGFPVTLKNNGYSTIFFTTHDDQFDNMAGFMYANGFEKVVSQKDYPSEWVVGPTGVPDHILFEQSIQYLNALSTKGKPFFAALLTASDHGPYFIPSNIPFKPKYEGILNQIIEYADWSLSHFMDIASKQPWFNNTVFVFVADHGASLDPKYELPISYVHSPCIIYSKQLPDMPKTIESQGSQIDVFPTVMGILGLPYTNQTFGTDILHAPRPVVYFSADEKIGCIAGDYYFLRKGDGSEALYNFRNNSTIDEIAGRKALADSMKTYTYSMMQSAQMVIKQNTHKQKK
ncbi:MAG: LTA synthase family protein [Ignavibacteria bacterium]|nr:LTA synthase family protein [Ignavibacteria bacterium]